jgi:predicted RNA-binding Zn-ribbon protein involved in translation (DUF1610 family)
MTTARAVTTTAYAAVCVPTRRRGQPSRPADQPTSGVDLRRISHTEGYYAGIRVVAAPPAFTSHDCSGCGERAPERLRVRTHSCPSCGQVLDRDENAAVTLRAEETPAASLGTRACAPVGAMPRRGDSMTCVGGDGYHSGGAMPVHASKPCGSMGSANTYPFRGLARCQTSGRLFFLRRL